MSHHDSSTTVKRSVVDAIQELQSTVATSSASLNPVSGNDSHASGQTVPPWQGSLDQISKELAEQAQAFFYFLAKADHDVLRDIVDLFTKYNNQLRSSHKRLLDLCREADQLKADWENSLIQRQKELSVIDGQRTSLEAQLDDTKSSLQETQSVLAQWEDKVKSFDAKESQLKSLEDRPIGKYPDLEAREKQLQEGGTGEDKFKCEQADLDTREVNLVYEILGLAAREDRLARRTSDLDARQNQLDHDDAELKVREAQLANDKAVLDARSNRQAATEIKLKEWEAQVNNDSTEEKANIQKLLDMNESQQSQLEEWRSRIEARNNAFEPSPKDFDKKASGRLGLGDDTA
ncbi:uncharacterized protein KY384_008171 [Bacidia gigantensis]|uniref:uncharacterized protein n=1 Tax=Bacidia gigantensis TaxID=2732470 RepID=UPI001D056973|nr:uncharacterized protein KY384_008171 [Bacidia gigantensis]KAG8526742.1 hypothetical protein KY384_008171 [Bacidia gigantensis]